MTPEERLAVLEEKISTLSALVREHMIKEEKEREQLEQTLKSLESLVRNNQAIISTKTSFVGGIIATVSVVWLLATGVIQLVNHFLGK